MKKGGFARIFSSDTLTNSSCQFVQVDTKVNTTLLVLRELVHAEKRHEEKWGFVHVVSIT